MPKELLFIRADKVQIPDEHVSAFELMCQTNGVKLKLCDVSNHTEFKCALNGTYKYICFGGHGSEEGFGDQQNLTISWDDIGESLCEQKCFTPNAKILLYCCKGGLHEVSCKLIESCESLDFIMGVTNEQNSIDLLNAYSVFIYNMERNYEIGDEESSHRASYGTGIPIEHYHRRDIDQDTGEFKCIKCERYKQGMSDMDEECEEYDEDN